jgi:hypothetical protein
MRTEKPCKRLLDEVACFLARAQACSKPPPERCRLVPVE